MLKTSKYLWVALFLGINAFADVNLSKGIYEAAEEMMRFDEKMNQAIARHNGFDENDDEEMRLHDRVNDFEEIEDGYRLEYEVEDVENTKLHVDVEDGMLMVKTTTVDKEFMNFELNSSHSTTMSSYSFGLFIPNDADVNKMEQSYINGVLKIVFPKKIK
jgi:HSP20 family molecular chaperone IbpA